MIDQLVPIILQKKREIAILRARVKRFPQHALARLLRGDKSFVSRKSMKKALVGSTLAVIGEIKRKSPTNGAFAPIARPTSLAKKYIHGGANALSILTDEVFFGGKLQDLTHVAKALQAQPVPILRKDFIIDEIQIAEAILAGADAILCIVALLKQHTAKILAHAKAMGIETIVEVYDMRELHIALDSGAEIIVVNNRNLSTFQVESEHGFQLIKHIPKNIIKVAASGILKPELAQQYYRAGFNAVLIGEALVRSPAPADFIRACRNV